MSSADDKLVKLKTIKGETRINTDNVMKLDQNKTLSKTFELPPIHIDY